MAYLLRLWRSGVSSGNAVRIQGCSFHEVAKAFI
jgi:hypothetical protein